MATEQPPIQALRAGEYAKSRYSAERQPDCVMLCEVDGWIGVQDSKEYSTTATAERTTLGFTKAEFAAFLKGAKAGEFDHLIA
jgi:uncharacterized protein DUF397